jgi:basic membrane lipoprotein Med (substrate-binding protein (PBP1-ABC) superfamily)
VAGASKTGRNQVTDGEARQRRLGLPGRPARRKTRRNVILIGATVVVIAVASYALWPRHHSATPPAPASEADIYHRACILTDPGDPALSATRSGLQQAAKAKGDIDVQSYPIPTAHSNAAPYLSGLISNKCTLIVALGPQPAAAANAYAENDPNTAVRFITIGGQATQSAAVTALPAAGITPQAIAALAEKNFS